MAPSTVGLLCIHVAGMNEVAIKSAHVSMRCESECATHIPANTMDADAAQSNNTRPSVTRFERRRV
jgi:hypothetical protein